MEEAIGFLRFLFRMKSTGIMYKNTPQVVTSADEFISMLLYKLLLIYQEKA